MTHLFPNLFLSSCNTHTACGIGWAIMFQWGNSSMIWLGPQPGQRWCSAAATVVEPGGVRLAEGMESRSGWRWSCWCRCFSSGRSAPCWEPGGPSLLKNCRSTPAGGSTPTGSLKTTKVRTIRDSFTDRFKKASEERFLTMKAGITGCWNLVLKVCISCLVLAS